MTTASGHTAGRTPIGKVVATVEFDLYDGDKFTEDDGQPKETWPWFEYACPGVTKHGEIGVCRRQCRTLSARPLLSATGAKP